ncbi:hypothetical protein [Bacillus sp. JJ1562]|uniref:hypothetical protein n=1 Tax=Bacillus sp. JJ1562 TaxID=3122960 RepID=UPI003001979C
MLRNYNNKDFDLIEDVAYDRLSPDAITAFLWVTFVISAFMTYFISDAVDYSVYITNPIWSTIIKTNSILLVFHLLVTIFYSIKKNAFRFQRFQTLLLCFFGLKLSLEFYPFYFTAVEDRFAPAYMTTIGLLAIALGFVLLVVSVIRAIGRVKKGELREDGKGLYDFKQSKGYVSLPIIFGATMLGGAISQTFSSMGTPFGDMPGLFFILLLNITIQYAVAMVWPEFFLLAYGKFRFESFRIKMPKQTPKTGGRKVKR